MYNTVLSNHSFKDQLTRLGRNENPYGPSLRVREAIMRGTNHCWCYPYAFQKELVDLIAKTHELSTENILLTAGSSEGLRISGLAYGNNGGEIITADPSYLELTDYAQLFGGTINQVPLSDDLQYDLEAMEKRIKKDTKLVYICNPNNPTGRLIPSDQLRDFCYAIADKVVVFSDEAYFDYISQPNYPSMIEWVKDGRNILVGRTFSKIYGLAGIRIGYLVSTPEIIDRIKRVLVAEPNLLAIFAAFEAMKDREFYRFCLQKNSEAKEHLYTTLKDLNLFYHPSHTNFVFFKTGRNIDQLAEDFQYHGIQVGRPVPALKDWCRVSTGTMEDMEKLREAMHLIF